MKLISILLAGIFWCGFITGQTLSREQKIDSLKTRLKKDSTRIFKKTIVKPYLKLENRRSFIAKEKVNFLGFQAGVNIFQRHVFSAGYYFLDKRSRSSILLEDNSTGVIRQFSELNYYVFSYQYLLINRRFIQLNTPLEIGIGKYSGSFLDSASSQSQDFDGDFVPASAGFQLILKPLRWLGVSGTGGYRYVKQDAISVRFNGWYYSYGIWVDARYLMREFRYYLHKRKYRKDIRDLQH